MHIPKPHNIRFSGGPPLATGWQRSVEVYSCLFLLISSLFAVLLWLLLRESRRYGRWLKPSNQRLKSCYNKEVFALFVVFFVCSCWWFKCLYTRCKLDACLWITSVKRLEKKVSTVHPTHCDSVYFEHEPCPARGEEHHFPGCLEREKSAVREVVVTGVWPKITRTRLTFSTERRPLIALPSLSFFSPQPSTRLRYRWLVNRVQLHLNSKVSRFTCGMTTVIGRSTSQCTVLNVLVERRGKGLYLIMEPRRVRWSLTGRSRTKSRQWELNLLFIVLSVSWAHRYEFVTFVKRKWWTVQSAFTQLSFHFLIYSFDRRPFFVQSSPGQSQNGKLYIPI